MNAKIFLQGKGGGDSDDHLLIRYMADYLLLRKLEIWHFFFLCKAREERFDERRRGRRRKQKFGKRVQIVFH